MTEPRRLAPGPDGWPFIGNLPELRHDVLRLMMENFQKFGDVVRFKLGPLTVHLLSSPDQIGRVLKDTDNFDKKTRSSAMIERLTGNSLLVSNGETWQQQRRPIQRAFAPGELKRFVPMIVEETERLINRLEPYADSGEPIDIASEMMQITYRVVERALFSTKPSNDLGELESAIAIVLGDIYQRIETPFSIPQFIPTRHNRRYQESMKTLDSRVAEIIRQHIETPGDDLLHRLIQSSEGEPDIAELRNQAITLLIAGHETTASGLAWLFFLLSSHPDVEQKLVDEFRNRNIAVAGRGSELEGLSYTARTIKESFRLYPPIWALVRRVVNDQEIEGYFLPAGSRLVISPYVVHRHPEFWENPEVFNPDRAQPKNPLAYLAFGDGPRICVGQNLARIESQIIVAKLIQRFHFRLIDPQEVSAQAGITLKPRDGIKMRVERRD